MTTPLSDPDSVQFVVVPDEEIKKVEERVTRVEEEDGLTDEEVQRLLNGEPLDGLTSAGNVYLHLPGEHPQKSHAGGFFRGALQGVDAFESAPGIYDAEFQYAEEGDPLDIGAIALANYKAEGYSAINGDLRSAEGKLSKVSNPKVAAEIKKIDGAFKNSPGLKEPIVVNRGVNNVSEIFGPPGTVVGTTYKDNAYVSTSALEGNKLPTVDTRSWGPDAALIRIRVPKGSKALGLDPKSTTSRELEIVLPRKSGFKIISDANEDGVRVLEVELVTQWSGIL